MQHLTNLTSAEQHARGLPIEVKQRRLSPHEIGSRGGTGTDFCDVLLALTSKYPYEAQQARERLGGLRLGIDEQQRAPATFGGVIIPWTSTRDLTAGTATYGGNLVGQKTLSFGDMLLEELRLVELGATFVDGLTGEINLARLTAAPTVEWTGEAEAASEAQPAFGATSLSPHHITGYVDVSRRLSKQSGVAVVALLMRQFVRVVAGAIEAAAIKGSGSENQPLGILNMSDVPVVSLGTDGGAPTWDKLVEMERTVDAANAMGARPGFLVNGATRSKLHRTQRFAGSDVTLYEALQKMAPVGVTNNVPSDLTKGSGTDLSALLYGNWSDVIVGTWGGIELTANPYAFPSSGTVRVVVHMFVDVALAHAESFVVAKDAITV